MQYTDLAGVATNGGGSNAQKDLDTFLRLLRPLSGEGARYLFDAGAVLLDYANYAAAIVASLDAGALVPNETGLAGAQPLAKEDIQALAADLQNLLAAYATPAKQALQAKACGAANLISG